MRRLLWSTALVVCSAAPALPASPARVWLRRITLAASCAASAWDIQTTRAAVSLGAREGNPLFATSEGRPQWGHIIGIKAGLCAGMAVAQEKRVVGRNHPRLSDVAWTAANLTLAARFMAVSMHNRNVAASLRGR